jgi:hypothetical protein
LSPFEQLAWTCIIQAIGIAFTSGLLTQRVKDHDKAIDRHEGVLAKHEGTLTRHATQIAHLEGRKGIPLREPE